MGTQDFVWLVTVADTGHITAASEQIGVSQPTLSRAVHRMEAHFGTDIFVRLSNGVKLTPDGEAIIRTVRKIIALHDKLMGELSGLQDPERGLVRLAFLDSVATSLVPRLLGPFHQDHPGVRIELTQQPAHIIAKELATQSVDLAITSTRPHGNFAWIPLLRERLVAIVPPTHPLASRKQIRLTSLDGQEFVTTPNGFGYRRRIDAMLEQEGVRHSIAFESADHSTIEGLVAAGLGVAIVPESMAGHSGSVAISLQNAAARRTLALTYRHGNSVGPPTQQLISFIKDTATGFDGDS